MEKNFRIKFRKLVSTFFEDENDSRIYVRMNELLSSYSDKDLDFLKDNVERIYNKYIFEEFNIRDDDKGELVMDESGAVYEVIDVIDGKAVYKPVIIVRS